jgi:hypothetical protein
MQLLFIEQAARAETETLVAAYRSAALDQTVRVM